MSRINDFFEKCGLKRILITALLMRILFFCLSLSLGLNTDKTCSCYSDSRSYVIPAASFVEGGLFLNEAGAPETNRTPGYPFLIAGAMKLSNEGWPWIMVGLQYLLNLLSVYFVYRLTLEICGRKNCAAAAGLIAAMNLHDMSFCNFILTDSIAQSICLVGCYYFFRALRKFHFSDYLLSIAILTIHLFVRPSGLFLPFLLILGITIVSATRRDFRKALLFLLCGLIVTLLPISLWRERNIRTAGYDGFTSNNATTSYIFYGAGIVSARDGIDYYSAQKLVENDPRLSELAKEMGGLPQAQTYLAKELIGSNFPILAGLFAKGMVLQLFYPGLFDILRMSDSFTAYIDHCRTLYSAYGLDIRVLTRELLPHAETWLLLVSFLLQILFVFLMTVGLIRFCQAEIPWYVKLAGTGLILYFLVIQAGPVAAGAYSRYRLGISMMQTAMVGMAWLSGKKNKSVEESV